MAWKYVMFEVQTPADPRLENTRANPATSVKVPVLFPPELAHRSVALMIRRAFADDRKYADAVSAGFVRFNGPDREKGIEVYGRSESLNMGHDGGDGDIIHRVAGRSAFYYPGH